MPSFFKLCNLKDHGEKDLYNHRNITTLEQIV